MSNKVLITGASGFVGENLTQYLKKDSKYEIIKVSRNPDNSNDTSISYQRLYEKEESFETWIHLAGKAHDTDYNTGKEEFFKVNFELTKKLFDQFLNSSDAVKFIFVSSIAAASSKSETPLEENCTANPSGFYGESKRAAEEYITEHLPTNENKHVYILRPPMIHGPGNKGNLNLLYSIVNRGIPWPLGNFDNQRSFLSIDNLCYIIQSIIEADLETGIYHVSDDAPLSTSELVEMIAKVNAKKARIWNIPKPLIQMIAKAGNVLPLPLNEDRLEKLTENYLVSNEKIKKALGIERMPVSAKEGMIKTLKDFES